tara:strand:- start:346 stop:1185 length:840 start_codon:yes stop_codon:yes gene_type:complete
MKVITIEGVGFESCDDPVRTEEIINLNLLKNLNNVSDDYVYFSFPLAWGINNFGLEQVQSLLNQINNSLKEKIVYVCQHIQVKNLDFGDNIVFTPHSTVFDKFLSIPHHAPNKTNKIIDFKDREIEMSFVGSYSTHHTRKVVGDILSTMDSCVAKDTGNWHFYKKGKELEDSANFYVETLGNSKVSICPRGTGPSTIRMWESMAMGSVPVLISDSLQLPMANKVDWSEHIISVPERESADLRKHMPSEEKLKKMSENCIETYKKFFSEERMHEIIIGEL